jgi:hypothetical protein
MDEQGRFAFVSPDVLPRTGIDAASCWAMAARPGTRCAPVAGRPADYRATVAARRPRPDLSMARRCPDGQPAHHVRISGEPQFDGGRFAGYRGVASDVTAARLAGQQVLSWRASTA